MHKVIACKTEIIRQISNKLINSDLNLYSFAQKLDENLKD